MQPLQTYVLITPARNEAEFIERTIESVVAQSIRPLKWLIVSDASTDGTDDIVARYASRYPWIELHRVANQERRNFAAKVNAFNAGYNKVKHLRYEVIGSLDADLSFDPDYFSFLLGQLASNPGLGLVGTPFVENGGEMYDYRFVSLAHVSGACQLFRRTCFEDIGGYIPIQGGGIDRVAVLKARARGWATQTFTEKTLMHHRKMGTATGGAMTAIFKQGVKDYSFGNHPLWELFRGAYQIAAKRPYVIGGLALISGYASAMMKRPQRPISDELVAFQRKEQMDRLKALFTRRKTTPNPAAAGSPPRFDSGRS
jgi:glycosyltransferase involved in cell wall biosynthesis